MHVFVYLLLALSLPACAAGPATFGAKGGVLLAPVDKTVPIGDRGGVGDLRDFIRPYVVGPTVVVDLPFKHFRLEADAFYRRLSRDESRFLGGFGNIRRFSGNTCEFPLLLEKRLPFGAFAGGGASLRHIWNMTVETEVFNGGMAPDQLFARADVDLGDATQGGWVLAGGLERDQGRMRWSLEVRYTRWTSTLFQPSRNQTDLLVGFRF